MAIQTDGPARELILFDGTNQTFNNTAGNGAVGPVNNVGKYSQLEVYLEITGVFGGTTPTLDVYLDTSSDGGTTWYVYSRLGPAAIAAMPALGNPPVYPTTFTLSCGIANQTAGSFGDCMRVRYLVGGTAASLSGFRVRAIGKPA